MSLLDDKDRALLNEFINLLTSESRSRMKTAWLPTIGNLLQVAAIVWGASTIVSEVKVLRRDHDAVATEVRLIVSDYIDHVRSADSVRENLDLRLKHLEEKVGLPTNSAPPLSRNGRR